MKSGQCHPVCYLPKESTEGAKETAAMGWSEQYWEDVKSELEEPATELEPTSEDATLDPPAFDQRASGQPVETSGKG
jgi:hypothetical protein